MSQDPTIPATPLPIDCDTTPGRPCPYHQEIALVRQWRKAGLEELMILSKRRDRWNFALFGVVLACLISLGGTSIWGGIKIASELGELSGTTRERLNVVEARSQENDRTIESFNRSARDSQTTVLVTLGEMREQLRAIDARIQRVEDQGSRRR